ncbi:MAG: hypothetical protein HOB63_00190 [Opitutae bacterium]|nr:hypothetical protein [Opitutae bacterium]
MKKILIISLTLAFGLGGLWAEDKPAKKERKPAPQRGAPPNREAILKKFDKDGDGKLNEEERAEARKSFGGGRPPRPPAELIKKFDKDGDGKLNEEERAALREEGQKRRKEIIAKFDKDGDGKLNEEERKAAGAEMRKSRGGRPGGDAGKPGKRTGKRPAPGEGDGRPKGGKRPGKKGTIEK